MESNNREKLEEINSRRHTQSESSITVTKGKGNGQGVWEGRDKGREKKGDIRINMYNAWARVGKGKYVQHREDK